MKITYLLILLFQILLLTNCELPNEDNGSDSYNDGGSPGGGSNGLSTNPVGTFSGKGDFYYYKYGTEKTNQSAQVKVSIINDEYSVRISITGENCTFRTTNNNVSYKYTADGSDWLITGSVSLGSTINKGNCTWYKITSDGSKSALKGWNWDCSK